MRVSEGRIADIETPVFARDVKGAGPLAALRRVPFQNMSDTEKRAWAESARIAAILGNCPKTIKSMQSGARCWIAFLGNYLRFWTVRYRVILLAFRR